MPFIAALGSYLPSNVVNDSELAARLGSTEEWIRTVAGIEERRYADEDESVDMMAAEAGRNCLAHAGIGAHDVGMLIVSSGSAERRFPGPASAVAKRLRLRDVPAIDLPIASAGSLLG